MAEITPQDLTGTDFAVREHRSLWGDAWLRLISSNTARIGMVIVTLFIVTTVLSHFFWAYNPKTDLNYALKLKPPNLFPTAEVESIHPFGTDKLGRDIFTRVIHGGWNSLRVGLVAVGISLSVGGILGLLAGFYESMQVTTTERYFLKLLIGLLLGALAAWISGQWLQMVLLALLGLISVRFDNLLSDRPAARVGLFASLGLLIGGGLALLVNPYVAIVCGLLGGLAGGILSMNLGGSLFSAIIMRIMDVTLSFPGLLAGHCDRSFPGAWFGKRHDRNRCGWHPGLCPPGSLSRAFGYPERIYPGSSIGWRGPWQDPVPAYHPQHPFPDHRANHDGARQCHPVGCRAGLSGVGRYSTGTRMGGNVRR
jgi:ABC-type dipeptide/oligopeptide/nickel transport system permease subunit